MILSIIVFVLIFSLVVISHELGHLLIARLNGVRVKEFAIGMGPVIFKKRKKEIDWVIRLLPIGGACIFEGEDEIFDAKEASKIEHPEGYFRSANVWKRMAIILAGPFFNVILGFLLALVVVSFTGTDQPIVQDVMVGYPAEAAGIEAGDTIVKINGEKIYLYREVSLLSYINKGDEMQIEYERNGVKKDTVLLPKFNEEDNRYYIGFVGSGVYGEAKGFNIIKYAGYEVRYVLNSTVKSLGMLISGNASRDDIAGPVGITIVIDDAIKATTPYGILSVVMTLINLTLLLTVNLGVLNLLPIPALDGGRLLFLLIEIIMGKPLPPEKEGLVHLVGFVFIIALMVFVLYNDISKLFM